MKAIDKSKHILLFLVFCLPLVNIFSCVSADKYKQDMEQHADMYKKDYELCKDRLNSYDLSSITKCVTELNEVKASINDRVQRAYAEGQLQVWQSLSIVAQPYIKDHTWPSSDDYYIDVKVFVGGHEVYKLPIQTKNQENGVFTTMSSIEDIATIVKYLPK